MNDKEYEKAVIEYTCLELDSPGSTYPTSLPEIDRSLVLRRL